MKQQPFCRLAACMTALAAVFSLMSCGKEAFQTELQETTSLAEETTLTETETTAAQSVVTSASAEAETASGSPTTAPLTAAVTTTTTAVTTVPRTTTTTTTTTTATTAAPRTTAAAAQTTTARTAATARQTATTTKKTTVTTTTTTKKTTAATTTKKTTTTTATTTATAKQSAGLTEAEVYAAMIAMQKVLPEGTPNTNADYYAWKGGIFRGGYGCAAFAFRLSDAAFGNLPARKFYDYKQLRVGDLLRVLNDTHFVVVLEIRGDELVLAEGNYDGRVHWFRTMPMSEVFSGETAYAITRYPA